MIINSIYDFLVYELKAFPNAYFDIARNLSHSIETSSSIMNGLSIIFGFFMMFGGLALFIGIAIIILPLLLVFAAIVIMSENIQQSVFPKYEIAIDIIAIPILLALTYYFGHTYLSLVLAPAFNFGLNIILSLFSIPMQYSS
ncbi:hypothetical protein FQ082_08630 [Psychrobacter sp. ANT_H56B]|uniref:hypothetical protein n=1 Tax=unclassified Psychrobacter TaxID=196806 RepID=UPI0011F1E7E1|nr:MULTISPECIES: hypothetical protein [unclassified Psychrobacter]KAA0925504.1 hypothetical protein FQ082_08630 [Psychrobacter sp. ANT_H56B]MBA2058686.1 hypothetical protein [Psychrobacter sp. D2]